jgi:hypothetical protein
MSAQSLSNRNSPQGVVYSNNDRTPIGMLSSCESRRLNPKAGLMTRLAECLLHPRQTYSYSKQDAHRGLLY